jgi:hypothetical protein
MLSWRCASSSRWNIPNPRAGHAGDTTGEVYTLSLNNLTALPVNSLYIMGKAYTQLKLNIISAQDLKKIHLFGMTYGVVWINFEKKLTTQIDNRWSKGVAMVRDCQQSVQRNNSSTNRTDEESHQV